MLSMKMIERLIRQVRPILNRLLEKLRQYYLPKQFLSLDQGFHSTSMKLEENLTPGVKGAAKAPLQGRGTASPWGHGGEAPEEKLAFQVILKQNMAYSDMEY